MNNQALDSARYIAIEGPIGVGKSSLAKKLANQFGSKLVLEQPAENPFLPRFYETPERYALSTQLFFLFQRVQQLSKVAIGKEGCVADFMMEKDPLFAEVNLDDDELQLYRMAYDNLTINITAPDLVIYLQAPVDVLLQRVERRQVNYEQDIDPEYLQSLSDIYSGYFYHYDRSPLLTVNAAEINFVDNPAHYQTLVNHIRYINAGKHFFNPYAES